MDGNQIIKDVRRSRN